MSVYSLKCTVCKEHFTRGQDWLKHLTGDNHQDLARKEWSIEDHVRERCLVVFTTDPLDREGADKVVLYFSNQTTFVSDFVWWEDRPTIAIVQFDSRVKVDDVLNGLEASSELQICNKRVQVKGAFDLLELEWKALVPGGNGIPSPHTNSVIADLCMEPKRRKRACSESAELPKNIPIQSDDKWKGPPPKNPSKNLQPPPSRHYASIVNTEVDKMPVMYEQCPASSLRHQFWLIRKSVVITDSKNYECGEIVDSLRKIFQNRCFSNRVTIFRNWHLNLRHPVKINEEEELLIFAYSVREPLAAPHSHTQLPSRLVLELLGASNETGFELLSRHYVVGCKMKYKKSAIPIRLFTYSETMGEVQVCRLLKYLCLFDPRCHPLLILTHYWIFKNNLKFSTKEDPATANLSLPEPLNFQWLVIHFMCHRNYIPTVREIQSRPHEILSDRLNGTDIGFFADLKYVREWRLVKNGSKEDWGYCTEDFALNVITLFQEFLEFCGVFLNSGNFILNTRDGEVVEIENFLTSEPGNGWTTKMTETELALLKALHNPSSPLTNKIDHPTKKCSNQHYATDLSRWKLYMTHPFVFNWRFAIPHDIRKILKIANITATKLKTYINLRKSDGDQVATQMFGTLQNVLTLDKVYPQR